jgi:aryl-alcohol dehydrogenase-like predicted oxidoreductase
MTDRREFLQYSGTAALTALVPAASIAGQRKMSTRRIPGTDERLGIVGLGQSQAFRDNDVETSKLLLSTFFDHGGGYVDCRSGSMFHVASVSKTLGGNDAVFLGSYFRGGNSAESEAAAQRLRAIRSTDSLDLMQAVPEDGVPNWDTFRRWKEEGLTRFIGLARHNSRYYEAMMKIMATDTMDFVQVNLSLLESEAEDRILPMAMDKGVAVTTNRPFLNGRYFSIVKGHPLPAWAVEFDCTSWAQFSIKYILSHPAVVCVLTETSNPKHLLDNLGGGIGRLPDAATRKKMRQFILDLA